MSVGLLDDLASGLRSRLEPVLDGLRFVEGKHPRFEPLDRAAADADAAFHEAAIASVARSFDDPAGTNAVNVGGTIEVTLATARHGVRRVTYAGSSAVYRPAATLPCAEDQRPEPTAPLTTSVRITRTVAWYRDVVT